MQERWAYFNDLIGSTILCFYTMHSLLEIRYEKDGRTRSITINFNHHLDACTLDVDSIPLPPAKIEHHAPLQNICDVNLYAGDDDKNHHEALELVGETKSVLLFVEATKSSRCVPQWMEGKKASLPLVKKEDATLLHELFCVESFKAHLAFALQAHGEQKTPHGLPYSMHLLSVASEVMNALSVEPLSFDEHNVALACALLHDVHEDTPIRLNKETYGADHAEVIVKGVMALTKDKSLSSKEAQMSECIVRLKQRQNCVVLVKLADRITNLGVPPASWSHEKKKAYVQEAKLILSELGYAHGYLARKLRDKICAYEQYL